MVVIALEGHMAVINCVRIVVQSEGVSVAGELKTCCSRYIQCVVAVDGLVECIDEAVVRFCLTRFIISNTLVLREPASNITIAGSGGSISWCSAELLRQIAFGAEVPNKVLRVRSTVGNGEDVSGSFVIGSRRLDNNDTMALDV